MDDLKNAMQIIDRHADKLPEGEYLEFCNLMRNLYEDKQGNVDDVRSVFTGVYIEQEGFEEDASDYFQRQFEERMYDMDVRLKSVEMDTIRDMIRELRPLQRITKNLKQNIIEHFSNINEITLPENTEACFKEYIGTEKDLNHMCKTYMSIENQFRSIVISDLNTRYRELQFQVDLMTEERMLWKKNIFLLSFFRKKFWK